MNNEEKYTDGNIENEAEVETNEILNHGGNDETLESDIASSDVVSKEETAEQLNDLQNNDEMDNNYEDNESDLDEDDDDDDGSNDGNASDEDEDYSTGEESDAELGGDPGAWHMGLRQRRPSNPDLPETVTTLTTEHGCKVFIVGTAHFSESSQQDVEKTISMMQPDVVLVELCKSRLNILQFDEKTLEEEAKNINMQKLRMSIKQSGFITGVMQILLLSMSAHLTKELGMAPGGEFRKAFHSAQKVPGCRVHLGDRPIQITLRRAMGELSVWQKVKLGWHLIMAKEPITKEEVEKCKQKDLLEEMLSEMTGEFPGLSRVFVEERDIYLAHSLQAAARPIPSTDNELGYIPSVVVGVVGMGHVPGIVENWDKPKDMSQIMNIPGPSLSGRIFKWTFKATLVGLLAWGCLRFVRWSGVSVYSLTS